MSAIIERSTMDECSIHEHYEKFEFPKVKERKNPINILVPAGEFFKVVRAQGDTGGKYMFAKVIVPPDVGPTPHIHHWTDEWFWAPNGGIHLIMGERHYNDLSEIPGESVPKDNISITKMRPKELFYGGRGHMHGFFNTTGVTQELYLVWTPDTPDISILDYFLRAGQVVDVIDQRMTPNYISRIRGVSLAPQWGINQSSSFWQYVNVGGVKEGRPHGDQDNQKERLIKLLRDGESYFDRVYEAAEI